MNESPDGAPRIGCAFGPWCRFKCEVCGGPFEADRETEARHCSFDCELEAKRRLNIESARRFVLDIPTHDENHATVQGILSLLGRLHEDDHLDADSAHPEDEGPEAKLAYVGAELERLWRRMPTGELDPEVYYTIKAMRERLGIK